MNYNLAIVGQRYRPPASALCQVLRSGTPLSLRPEPSNQYDPNAIQVILRSSDIPKDEHGNLEEILPGHGSDLETVLAQEEWHLGYIPANEAIWLAPQLNGKEIIGETSFDMKGRPTISFELVKGNNS